MTEIQMNHEEKLSAYRDFIDDKSIAIVGGDDKIDWQRVNAADVIVRVNSHWARQGGRCDVLYYSCADDLDIAMLDDKRLYGSGLEFAWVNGSHMLFNGERQVAKFALACDLLRKNGVKCLMYVLAPANAFNTFAVLRNLSGRYAWSKELATWWEFHPLTGMATLYHVLKHFSPEAVHLDGFSFYANEKKDVPLDAGVHALKPQMRFLLDMLADERLTISRHLQSIIYHEARKAI